ncbi:MAG TPA: potassium channel family protein [Bryobacteraceae bacterium]|nr:potassium channel family protein [Bryobacteraceae bacterium]
MAPLPALLGVFIILIIVWDAFETIVLPRRVTRQLRLTRLFYMLLWRSWKAVAGYIPPGKRREGVLSLFGPLSLLLLLGMWAVALLTGFALLQFSQGNVIRGPDSHNVFTTYLYLSGSTFFTLGLGDVVPVTPLARFINVLEAGTGFGLLAVVIGYLPVIYQSFSTREQAISLLDARAGSPSSAGELLRRHGQDGQLEALVPFLASWEDWAGELLESHLSYPVLVYYRSQHDNQSWIGALTTILDTCSLIISSIDCSAKWQARMTFAIARHAIVDLSQILEIPPEPPARDRLPAPDMQRLRTMLAGAGVPLLESAPQQAKLAQLRAMYEPYVNALARRLMFTLPSWIPGERVIQNWRTSAWEKSSQGREADAMDDEHA